MMLEERLEQVQSGQFLIQEAIDMLMDRLDMLESEIAKIQGTPRPPERVEMNTEEAAEYLGCKPSWVRHLCREGLLPHSRTLTGYRLVITLEDLKNYKNNRGVRRMVTQESARERADAYLAANPFPTTPKRCRADGSR